MAASSRQISVPELAPDQKYHVFISHSSEDKALSYTILEMLEQYQLKCLHYDRDFTPGTSVFQNIEIGIRDSRRVMLLVTDNFLESRWSIFEAQASLTKSIEQGKKVVIPVFHEVNMDKVPSYLKDINYLEYSNDKFWERLLKGIVEDIPLDAAIPAGNVAHGLAWSYHYGFLNLVLPGLKDRALASEYAEGEVPVFPKMVIILPESCFCPANLREVDENFEFKGHVSYKACRAGNINRDYKSSMWQVKDPDSDQAFLFLAEFATPLLSLYEMEQGEIAGMDRHQKIHQMMLFKEKLREILNHPCNQPCHNKAITIAYKDEGPPKSPDDKHVLSRIIFKRIQSEFQKEKLIQQEEMDTA